MSTSMRDQKFIMENIWKLGYVDDHDNRYHESNYMPIEQVGIWTNYERTNIIPVFKGTFCCNPFYIDESDKEHPIHLSACSCGGTVIGGNIDRYNHEMSPNNQDGWHSFEHIIPFTKEGWDRVKNRKYFA